MSEKCQCRNVDCPSCMFPEPDELLHRVAGSAGGPTPERYRWAWKGIIFDFYRLCEILGIKHHAQAHALKKLIRAGRSVKPIDQDIDETIDALLRWKEMLIEDRQNDQGHL